MRIGLVAARYAPEFEGGSERVVRTLARGLFARGHEVCVVAGTDAPLRTGGVLRDEQDGIPVFRLARAPDERFDLELVRPRLETLAAQCLDGCDLAHVHHWSTLSARLVRTLARELPVVVTLHDAFATCPRFFRASPLGIRCPGRGDFEPCARCIEPEARPWAAAELEPRLALRAREFEAEIGAAQRWIVPSASHGELLSGQLALDERRRVVIAPGLTRSLRRARRTRAPGALLRLLHFGNLGEEKGTFDLVKSMALLPPGTATLTLAGRALAPDLRARVERLRGTTEIRVAGSYGALALERLAADADLALFPSRVPESYGLVLDEAHALGLPAWVSDRGAPCHRLAPGERRLPAEDPPAWAAALAEVARDRAPLARSARALESWRASGPEDSTGAHEELYASVLAGART